jgi:hypothetical protein
MRKLLEKLLYLKDEKVVPIISLRLTSKCGESSRMGRKFWADTIEK